MNLYKCIKHLPCLILALLTKGLFCGKVYDIYDIELFQNKTSESMGYKKYVYPKYQMNASIHLFSFGSIDETRTEYTIQLLLRFQWFDERLRIDTRNNEILRLEGGQWHINRIWTPSIHIANNREPDILQNGDQNPVLTHIHSDGKVLVSKRILLNGFSKMNFRLYPLDKQLCDIEIESNELSDSIMRLEWNRELPFSRAEDFTWSGFQLVSYTQTSVKSVYSHTGTFSRLVATFTLKREIGHFILDIYIPSILFVISSWTSFWVEIPAAPARVMLGITTMLTLVTSAKIAREKLPIVSYIHALDIWIIMCTFFVFACLVEYATVNFIYNRDKRRKKYRKNSATSMNIESLKRNQSTSSFKSADSMYSTIKSNLFLRPLGPLFKKSNSEEQSNSYIRDMKEGGIELVVPKITIESATDSVSSRRDSINSKPMSMPSVKLEKPPQDIANDIDRKCRIIFPISFLIINLIYWTTLVLMSFNN